MLVLARLLEAGGVSTVLVTNMPSWADVYGVPRALAVEFPFGHALGLPDDSLMQTRVIRQALNVLGQADHPNTIVDSSLVWPGGQDEWRRRWQPRDPSPLIATYIDEIRQARARLST